MSLFSISVISDKASSVGMPEIEDQKRVFIVNDLNNRYNTNIWGMAWLKNSNSGKNT